MVFAKPACGQSGRDTTVHRGNLTFSVAWADLVVLAGLAHAGGLLPDAREPVWCGAAQPRRRRNNNLATTRTAPAAAPSPGMMTRLSAIKGAWLNINDTALPHTPSIAPM